MHNPPIQTPRDKAKQIMREVAEAHGVTPEIILGTKYGPARRWLTARGEFYLRIRKEMGWSYPKIARFANRRCHTTIRAAILKLVSGL